MKQLLLTATVALLSISANAQKSGFWITPFENTGYLDYNDGRNGTGAFNIGLGFQGLYMFNERLGAGVGLAYNAYSHESLKGTFTFPISLRYVTGKRKGFFIQPTVAPGFFTSNPVFYTYRNGFVKQEEKNTAMVASVNFGWYIPMGTKVHMAIGPEIGTIAPLKTVIAGLKVNVGIKTSK